VAWAVSALVLQAAAASRACCSQLLAWVRHESPLLVVSPHRTGRVSWAAHVTPAPAACSFRALLMELAVRVGGPARTARCRGRSADHVRGRASLLPRPEMLPLPSSRRRGECAICTPCASRAATGWMLQAQPYCRYLTTACLNWCSSWSISSLALPLSYTKHHLIMLAPPAAGLSCAASHHHREGDHTTLRAQRGWLQRQRVLRHDVRPGAEDVLELNVAGRLLVTQRSTLMQVRVTRPCRHPGASGPTSCHGSQQQ
jgi:hypothetical protein